MKVAVVGAGIVGLSTARALSGRGHRVTLYEQFPLFHGRGSSHGRSRIVRRAYADPFYTAIMAEAYPLWGELEAATGLKLVTECGLAYIGSPDAPRVQSMVAGLEELHVRHAVLDQKGLAEIFPEFALKADEVAILTPEAGWVAADRALAAIHRIAVNQGTEVASPQRVSPLTLAQAHDAVVVATGSWIRESVPSLAVQPTLQTFVDVQIAVSGPVWIDDENLTYGFPTDAIGLKVGAHSPGPKLDPDRDPREPYPPHLEEIRETLAHRFGCLDPEFTTFYTCPYTTTESEDFRFGTLAPNVFYASACSGHGFKLGPWVGQLMANFVEGTDHPERHPRFQA